MTDWMHVYVYRRRLVYLMRDPVIMARVLERHYRATAAWYEHCMKANGHR